jgi:single-strand DNA-binding protein
VHYNRQTLLGRISKRPELRYNTKGTPYCSLTLAVDKPGRDEGQVYTSWHQVEITGRFAEDLSVTLEAGDEILVEGEHQHRSLIDPKTVEKKKWCVLSDLGHSPKRQPRWRAPGEDFSRNG